MPSLTLHSTNLGSSSASRTICGFVLGAFSAAMASLAVFFVEVAGAGAVIGQYPGPVSEPSLLATRITSNSLMSAMVTGFGWPTSGYGLRRGLVVMAESKDREVSSEGPGLIWSEASNAGRQRDGRESVDSCVLRERGAD